MAKEVIRVEPLTTYLERVKAPACVATRHNDTVYVSGLPPFDPQPAALSSMRRSSSRRSWCWRS